MAAQATTVVQGMPNIAALPSDLLELDERAGEVLGAQEDHRLAVRPDAGLAIAQHAGAGTPEPVAGGEDVLDLEADMVDAARRVALQELADRRALAQGRQ